jgi:hypothetical protein
MAAYSFFNKTHCATWLTAMLQAGCGSDGSGPVPNAAVASASESGQGTQNAPLDLSCDDAPYPSAQWTQCEQQNFSRTGDAIREQISSPQFLQRYQTQSLTNTQSWLARAQADNSWVSPQSGNTNVTPLCALWAEPCVGDPHAYPEADGSDGKVFYTTQAKVIPVVFYDRECARISDRVWAPKGSRNGD